MNAEPLRSILLLLCVAALTLVVGYVVLGLRFLAQSLGALFRRRRPEDEPGGSELMWDHWLDG